MDLSIFALTGKVAIITGGGKGIGRDLAMGFANAGANVVVAARTVSEIDGTVGTIRDAGGKAIAVPTDVQEVDQVTNLLDKTLESFGQVDILVNNAGGFQVGAYVSEMNIDAWEAVVRQNLTSTFICSKLIGKAMMQQKRGNIINISSVAGLGPYPRYAHYAAAKAGMINLTKTLAVEWAPCIRINAIAPGIIMTPIARKIAPESSSRRQAQLKRIPLGRFGETRDIANAAIFLASDASAFITGETIVISGGMVTTVFDA